MGRREAEGGPDPLLSLWFCLRQSWACRAAGGGLQTSLPVWRERHTILLSGQPHLSTSGSTGDPPTRQGPGRACPPPGPVVWGLHGGWKPFSDPSHFPPSRRDLWGAWLCAHCPPPAPPTLSGPRDVKTVSTCSVLPGRPPRLSARGPPPGRLPQTSLSVGHLRSGATWSPARPSRAGSEKSPAGYSAMLGGERAEWGWGLEWVRGRAVRGLGSTALNGKMRYFPGNFF